jgi:RNA polymerase sigma-70 factor (ECF subfamily)
MSTMEKQFTDAYHEHLDALFRYALFKVNDRDLAKDMVQDVLMNAWGYVVEGKEIGSFKSLFFRILHNRIIDHYRKKKSSSLDVILDQGYEIGVDTHDQVIDILDGKKAMEYINRLPSEYKDVLFMRFVDDLTIAEIADVTHESKNTVTVRIHRGLAKLRVLLENTSS